MHQRIFSANRADNSARTIDTKNKLGAAPGTIEYTGKHTSLKTRVFITEFDEKRVHHYSLQPDEPIPARDAEKRWIQISGLQNTNFIKTFGARHGIHPLVLEDIVNPNQPPKVEVFDDFLFFVMKVPVFAKKNMDLQFEHVCFLLFENLVVSFQETETFHFEAIHNRLNNPQARMRQYPNDYFLYALLDVIVDHYFYLGDLISDKIEILEKAVIDSPDKSHIQQIHIIKHQISNIRKAVRPMRLLMETLNSGKLPLISSNIEMYLRDLKDHVLQVIDTFDGYREISCSLMDTHLSQMSHRINETMKILTTICAIFIPMGVIAGLYGMNFSYLPGLQLQHGYVIVLAAMFCTIIFTLILFQKKRWL